MRIVIGAAVVLASAMPAAADPLVLVASRWPLVPRDRGLSLEDKITDRLTQIGNTLGQHLDLLSHEVFQLKVDGRGRRARIRFGGGDDALLSFRFDSDIRFDDLNAHVDAHIDLGFRGHLLRLDLPAFRMQPAEYRGDYGIQIEVPVLVQKF